MPIPLTSPKIPAASSPVIVKEVTQNRKLGNTSTTYASQHSCPKTCPWFNAGCYAESGGPATIITRRLNANSITNPLSIAKAEAEGIRGLSGVRPLRLHVVGDTTTNQAAQILALAAADYTAKNGMPVWTYTHGDTNRESWGNISTLRSVETLQGVKDAHENGFASAMVVAEFQDTKPYDLGDGFTGVPCLEQTGKALDCSSCKLCTKDALLHSKKRVILFKAHGSGKNRIRKALPVLNG